MRLKRGERGNQSANARGDADSGGQDVVGEKRSGSEQARKRAKVGTRNGVGATAGGIGSDGLQIGKVDDGEKSDNRQADGDD